MSLNISDDNMDEKVKKLKELLKEVASIEAFLEDTGISSCELRYEQEQILKELIQAYRRIRTRVVTNGA